MVGSLPFAFEIGGILLVQLKSPTIFACHRAGLAWEVFIHPFHCVEITLAISFPVKQRAKAIFTEIFSKRLILSREVSEVPWGPFHAELFCLVQNAKMMSVMTSVTHVHSQTSEDSLRPLVFGVDDWLWEMLMQTQPWALPNLLLK